MIEPSLRLAREPASLVAGVSGMAGTHVMGKTFCQNVHRAPGGDLFRLAKAMWQTACLTTVSYLSFRQDEIDRAILHAQGLITAS